MRRLLKRALREKNVTIYLMLAESKLAVLRSRCVRRQRERSLAHSHRNSDRNRNEEEVDGVAQRSPEVGEILPMLFGTYGMKILC